MNTPAPCHSCGWLYADCMQKDNPDYAAECMCEKKDCTITNKTCPNYIDWEKFNWATGKKTPRK